MGKSLSYTELALTLGNWGRAPIDLKAVKETALRIHRWSSRSGVGVRLELYAETAEERDLTKRVIEETVGNERFELLVRLEPRTDRWRDLAAMGVKRAVFDAPIGEGLASIRFSPHGSARTPEFTREAARGAMLVDIEPEIALTDITRADPARVADAVRLIEEESLSRGVPVRWRLVDDLGLGDPLPGGKRYSSLAGWVRLLTRDLGVTADRVTVQASDQRGLALANTLAGVREGASGAVSLFGLGLGSGWAATEQLLYHLGEPDLELKSLLDLRSLLKEAGLRDSHRPISGASAWEMLGGSAPEELDKRYKQWLGLDPVVWFGSTPLPLLTSLSGHAGMLHLMHRHYPDHHFESDDPRSLEVSAVFEEQFNLGRQIPVSWSELYPKLKAAGLFEGATE